MRLLVVFITMVVSSFCMASDSAPNGGGTLYAIQLGASAQPDLKRFSKIKKYGHLYTVDVGNGMQRVMLGSYTTKSKANRALSSVKSKGFKDAFLSASTLGTDEVYVVQFRSYAYSDKVDWAKLQEVGNIQIDPSEGKIKVVSGSFGERYVADSHVQSMNVLGYSDAFVRKINPSKLINVGVNYGNTIIAATGGEVSVFEDMPIYASLSEYERKSVVLLDGIYNMHDKANSTFIPLSKYTPGTLGGSVAITTPTTTYSTYTEPAYTTSATTYTPTTTTYNQPVYSQPVVAADAYVPATEYRIQLAAVRNYDAALYDAVSSLGSISLEDNGKGINRVLLGNFGDQSSARSILSAAKAQGFPGAYIIRYDNGVRGSKVN